MIEKADENAMTKRRPTAIDNLSGPPQAVPVSVVTGFLGAGKTSLIRHILARGKGRFALLVNEFGERGVDGDLLRDEGGSCCPAEGMIELNNGCICCTVADDFLPAMSRLREAPRPFDHVLVETSGLALPGPLVDAFRWPEIRGYFRMDSLIGVVDAEALADHRFPSPNADDDRSTADDESTNVSGKESGMDHSIHGADLLAEQIRSCDLIALNKTDRIDAARLRETTEIIHRMSHGAKILPCIEGRIPLSVLLGHNRGPDGENHRPMGGDGSRQADHHHDDHHHDDFLSFVLTPPSFHDDEDAADRLARAARIDGVLRIKGHVRIRNKPMPLVMQAVGRRSDVRYARRPVGANHIVVIAQKGCDTAAIHRILGTEG